MVNNILHSPTWCVKTDFLQELATREVSSYGDAFTHNVSVPVIFMDQSCLESSFFFGHIWLHVDALLRGRIPSFIYSIWQRFGLGDDFGWVRRYHHARKYERDAYMNTCRIHWLLCFQSQATWIVRSPMAGFISPALEVLQCRGWTVDSIRRRKAHGSDQPLQ